MHLGYYMSTNSLIGGVIGAVIGFWIGGPVGAAYGAAIGFGMGMAYDAMQADMPSPGAPALQGLQIMTNEVGRPISEVLGTTKCSGNLLWYGLERSVAQYQETGGKGGGGDSQITGYKYYMSWAVGLCLGPVDTLYAVYRNDDIVYEGTLDCPVSGGEETITLSENMGSATFYFGTTDQVANATMGAALDDSTLNPPNRGLCWVYFDDCYIGDYNRCPTMKFVLKKLPTCSFDSDGDYTEIQTYDCNAMHAAWHILHNLTGLPEAWLHDADFLSAAIVLSGEYRGISMHLDQTQSALAYLETINAHIDGILRYGSDAMFHPKLLRDDYTAADLPVVDEADLLDEISFDRKSWIDTINEVKVQYSEIINVERLKLGRWDRVANFGTNERRGAFAGSTDTKIYAGCGYDPDRFPTHLRDWWEYDPEEDSWATKTDFPGDGHLGTYGRFVGAGVAAGGKVYIGLGSDGYEYYKDWWEYDPEEDAWTQKADFTSTRGYPLAVECAGKIYAGLGRSWGGVIVYDDWHEYDPTGNTWTPKTSMTLARRSAIGASVGGKVYVGTGYNDLTATFYLDWWEYDPEEDSWAEKANPPYILSGGVAVACGSKIYVGTVSSDTQVWYAYDPDLDTWTEKAVFDGIKRNTAIAGMVNDFVYFGTGLGVDGLEKLSWWKYTP